jgi:hypothetical protein
MRRYQMRHDNLSYVYIYFFGPLQFNLIDIERKTKVVKKL